MLHVPANDDENVVNIRQQYAKVNSVYLTCIRHIAQVHYSIANTGSPGIFPYRITICDSKSR